MAGAILEGEKFPWSDKNLKQKTQWRLLTVGINADHYEARSVKIGDWTGTRLALQEFFTKVCKLVEVDLALGSLLYRDEEVCVFSFPGERPDYDKPNYQGAGLSIIDWGKWLTKEIDTYAQEANFETPPYCKISAQPSRSLAKMTEEICTARQKMAVPLHRPWNISGENSTTAKHVCPVCLVRPSAGNDKQSPCAICKKRRTHRLDTWLEAKETDSIWISEVADANDRVALVTMSLDIEGWMDGTRLDALRTQAISEWRKNNPVLSEFWQRDKNKRRNEDNAISLDCPFDSLQKEIRKRINDNKIEEKEKDLLLCNLQEGYRYENAWPSFFSKIVEDRAKAPQWDKLANDQRAAWLAHQFFCKLASPGRIYRFERQAEEFFTALLGKFREIKFREIAAADENRWRVRRLLLKAKSGFWEDRQVYNGRHEDEDAPISLVYRKESQDFLTICNLARLLNPEEGKEKLQGIRLKLTSDESTEPKELVVQSVHEADTLGVYHPVIPLDLSPVRFRVLLPLEAASHCVDRAIAAWQEQFARVWDRLPLRIGIVAFPRKTPFQAVIEAARNLEEDLSKKQEEIWKVQEGATREGMTALRLKAPTCQHEMLQNIPVTLPDDRDDVFYPYLHVEDQETRFPLDFQHPDKRVFRHAKDLQIGDGIQVHPSCVSTIFLENTTHRFEALEQWTHYLNEWPQMRKLWEKIEKAAPSQTALRGAWSEIIDKQEAWKGPDKDWLEGGKQAWLNFARVVLHERLEVQGAFLETLVEAAGNRLLEWSLDWHLSVLKKQVSEVQRDNE